MPQDETSVSEAEVEAAARALAREEEDWEDNWRTKIVAARAALTAAAQMRGRAGERANWTVRVNPDGSVTSLEPDSGPDVLGMRKGEE